MVPQILSILDWFQLVVENRLKIKNNPLINRFDHSNVDKLMKEIYIKEFFESL